LTTSLPSDVSHRNRRPPLPRSSAACRASRLRRRKILGFRPTWATWARTTPEGRPAGRSSGPNRVPRRASAAVTAGAKAARTAGRPL